MSKFNFSGPPNGCSLVRLLSTPVSLRTSPFGITRLYFSNAFILHGDFVFQKDELK